MTSSKTHKRKNSHLFLQRQDSSMSISDIHLQNMNTNSNETSDAMNQPRLNMDLESLTNESDPPRDQSWNGFSWDRTVLHKKFKNKKWRNTLLMGFFSVSTLLFIVLYISNISADTTVIKPDNGSTQLNNKRTFSINDVMNGDFIQGETSFRFIRPPHLLKTHSEDPGLYFTVEILNDQRTIVAKHLYDDFYRPITPTTFTYNDKEYLVESIEIDYSLKSAIIGTNIEKQFRHSSIGNYFLKDIETGAVKPLSLGDSDQVSNTENNLLKFSYVHYSPSYNYIYVVLNNDLYIQGTRSSKLNRVTFDGSVDIMNAKPDWVYEEEVLGSEKAIWWAEDDSKFVYARFNDTLTPSYDFPLYTPNGQYSTMNSIKYPKPGKNNAKVDLFMFDIESSVIYAVKSDNSEDKLADGTIVYDASWIGPKSFLFKTTDRTSKRLKVNVYTVGEPRLKVPRSVNADTFNGWIEKTKDILVIPPNESVGRKDYGYVDVQASADGYNHLFYFSSANEVEGKQLTSGNWEITGDNLAFEFETNKIFFTSNKAHPMTQQLYAIELSAGESGEMITLQDPNKNLDYYSFDLSSSCRYAISRYLGPDIPYTRVGELADVLSHTGEVHEDNVLGLTDNSSLNKTLEKVDLPITSYNSMVLDDGIEINYVEIRPAKMSSRRKYPLLVNVYGGPGSQTFTTRNTILFEQSVSSGLDAIVLQIEPRGTGGKGWSFRSWARRKIGYWEPRDVTAVTKKFIETHQQEINMDKVAIWGWSYGGFTTLKTIEYDQGNTFKYAMAVAPVTDWVYYDSIYTERYMGYPTENLEGYNEISLVKDVKPFGNINRFLLVHGTADDNVHIQNTYNFVDKLDLDEIDNYDMQIYPDSNHSIMHHNALKMVYKRLYDWLDNAFSDQFDQQ
ncbi:hypothetical protein Kpol_1072p38 [Vanderwaltozyma polyspora DSM 70294]|uniref:Dipeptidyl aminopeptidase A n=1 Tax=Vanderwaltozyma polyspora (strain ATCC 22028 / DSM 70294 / BCRC 21397 / CBS 2163 / NBRC 10782 / NRRL Y-8283 / UCD 57-17) TaxID=436907 RepID=A7TKQ6_VANPO|nr:uncharacterized protein Kpol_1072p38 [Vanderwaltozyma polyspora DSM 70294]EDO17168.1 hypothetical protein Kpol_1072p38 [Vanderwaltozyma polyspora DSM 70294]